MKLRTALVQTDVEWGDLGANLDAAGRAVRDADASLVVLPEMFNLGYDPAAGERAEPPGGPTSRWMSETAARFGKAVTGSFAVCENGRVYNRMLFAFPDGRAESYDKRHLFSFSGENMRLASGSRRTVVEWGGFRILLQVCYDLRFPVWTRARCPDEYDLILYVASWDRSRIGVWDILLKARAIENQCYVAGVNRVGTDPPGSYDGHSVGVDYFGRTVASLPENVAGTVVAEFDLDALRAYRDRFRAWADADRFTLE